MELGNKIRELRLKKSATQEQLARQLHVSAQCVSKWETGVTMPDIQLLPELSACLGVTIDELFDLTDDTRLHRISSMLENTRMLDEAEFRSMEQFLRGKTETNPNASQYFALLSELYCHMAGGYREKAAHNAREALRLDPDDKWNHSLLRMAEDGSLLDWNFSNHTKRILYYRCFLREHPGHVRGCLCLLDELLADHLLEEAEKLLAQMGDRLGDVRSSTYAGRILWEQGKHEDARAAWDAMCRRHPDDWLAHACAADCLAHAGCFSEAAELYRESLRLQEKPRYTDSAICIAQICELQGAYAEAIEAWNDVMQILKEEHGVSDGECLDAPAREIERLSALCRENSGIPQKEILT